MVCCQGFQWGSAGGVQQSSARGSNCVVPGVPVALGERSCLSGVGVGGSAGDRTVGSESVGMGRAVEVGEVVPVIASVGGNAGERVVGAGVLGCGGPEWDRLCLSEHGVGLDLIHF